MPRVLALLPLVLATGCLHLGTFEPPLLLPQGQGEMALVGAVGASEQGLRADYGVWTTAQGRLSLPLWPGNVSVHVGPGLVGAGVRWQAPTDVPLALFGGGGVAFAVTDCEFISCAQGPSGYVGASVGARVQGVRPYASARLILADVRLKSCGDNADMTFCDTDERLPRGAGAVSVGLVPTGGRVGLGLEGGVFVRRLTVTETGRPGRAISPTGGVLVRLRLGPPR